MFFFLIILLTTTLSYSKVCIVQKNDSLWKIASMNQISLSDLRKLNDCYTDKVHAGQHIFIPDKIILYRVQANDTFQSIAKSFAINMKYIIMLNNISEQSVIEGQILRIPIHIKSDSQKSTSSDSSDFSKNQHFYQVSKGDTLYSIAAKYKLSITMLKKLNNKTSDHIYIGEKLYISQNIDSISEDPVLIKKDALDRDSFLSKVPNSKESIKQNHENAKDSLIFDTPSHEKESVRNSRTTLQTYQKAIPLERDKSDEYKEIKYTVKRGDTLYSLSNTFGIMASDIKKWSKKNNDSIYVGEILTIYVKKSYTKDKILFPSYNMQKKETKAIFYKVKRGDTLDRIASKYNVTRSKLQAWNKKKHAHIYIGEKLTIYIPSESCSVKENMPFKKSKKAQYLQTNSSIGIKSNRFNDVALPVKYSQLLKIIPSGRGADLELKGQTQLYTPINATVQYAGYINALQNVVILELSGKRMFICAGLDRLNVCKGQKLKKGDFLGISGMSKLDKIPKVYVELRERNKVVNVSHIYKSSRLKKI